jgi:hypothetical protein
MYKELDLIPSNTKKKKKEPFKLKKLKTVLFFQDSEQFPDPGA